MVGTDLGRLVGFMLIFLEILEKRCKQNVKKNVRNRRRPEKMILKNKTPVAKCSLVWLFKLKDAIVRKHFPDIL